VVAAVDFGHALFVAWFWAGSGLYKTFQLVEGSSYELPGWILAALAAAMIWRHRQLGLKFAVLVGASAALFTGCFDFTVFNRSQAPFDGPILLDRIFDAICLGLGICVAVGAICLLRRPADQFDTDPPPTVDEWIELHRSGEPASDGSRPPLPGLQPPQRVDPVP
jgi:hypothetical protein